jgi:hypothetical protein
MAGSPGGLAAAFFCLTMDKKTCLKKIALSFGKGAFFARVYRLDCKGKLDKLGRRT